MHSTYIIILGTSLMVSFATTNPVTNCAGVYTVAPGDSCYKIAQTQSMTDYHTLNTYNSAGPKPLDCDNTFLNVGQVLCVKTVIATPTSATPSPTKPLSSSPTASVISSAATSTTRTPAPSRAVTPSARSSPTPSGAVTPSARSSPTPSRAVTPSARSSPTPSRAVTPSARSSPTPSQRVSPARSATPSPTRSPSTSPPSSPFSPTQVASNPSLQYLPIQGKATFYTDNESLCLGSSTKPKYAVAMNGATGMSTQDYDPKFCGKCVYVWSPKGAFTATVVDVCDPSNCDYYDATYLDIYGATAFSELGAVLDGLIDVNWEWVNC
ncbi:hypothetical protein SeLEV6574_g05447 [Synchytrium endobioticum]|uniref:LysM domain-containing protein n=1 Tax=Synchytrium endobioticum TaxID=286115 RepID=A0A507CUC9_9FUNG|nr:hypothetical protein SeLEV6574_g05447 [Synchytrium endobioticum]